MSGLVNPAQIDQWLRSFAALVAENRDHLTELDAAIGDADHGSNMDRGMSAATAALDDAAGAAPGALLTKVGMTLVSTVGGASGPLFGTLFMRMGQSLGGAPAGAAGGAAGRGGGLGAGGGGSRGAVPPGCRQRTWRQPSGRAWRVSWLVAERSWGTRRCT